MATTVTVERAVRVPPEVAFEAISDIERFPEVTPDVLSIEFLTESREGVGTRFRETRRMGKSEMVTELEVVEYDPGDYCVRMVTDSHGTIWDTRMSTRPSAEGCVIRFEMEARGSTWFKRAMNAVMRGLYRRGMAKHVAHLGAMLEADCA